MQISDLQGHWQRDWLRAPGLEDRATCVNWMQCGALYADIRIPRNRAQTRGATSLADLSCSALLKIMRAEGFAGEISLRGDICTWEREIDWHGPKDATDIGKLTFLDETILHEAGVVADYSEQWHRTGAVADGAMRLSTEGFLGFLVTVGERFVFGFGPRAEHQREHGAGVIAALEAGRKDEPALRAHFESAYIFGRWQNGTGIAIQSTNPLMEGEKVLFCSDQSVVFANSGYDGQSRRHALVPMTAADAASVFVA